MASLETASFNAQSQEFEASMGLKQDIYATGQRSNHAVLSRFIAISSLVSTHTKTQELGKENTNNQTFFLLTSAIETCKSLFISSSDKNNKDEDSQDNS